MSAILKQKLIDIANGFTKYGLWKGGGSSNLSELDDVTLTNLQTNDVLTYNGSKWVNDDNLQKQIDTLNSNFSEVSAYVNTLKETTAVLYTEAARLKIYSTPKTNYRRYFDVVIIGQNGNSAHVTIAQNYDGSIKGYKVLSSNYLTISSVANSGNTIIINFPSDSTIWGIAYIRGSNTNFIIN